MGAHPGLGWAELAGPQRSSRSLSEQRPCCFHDGHVHQQCAEVLLSPHPGQRLFVFVFDDGHPAGLDDPGGFDLHFPVDEHKGCFLCLLAIHLSSEKRDLDPLPAF